MDERVLSVGQVTHQIKDVLERGFTDLWIRGEIVGLKRHSSGHVYLTLKDDQARLNAVVFRSRLRFLAMTPAEMRDGLQVVCHGRLDVYPPHGSYKLLVEQMRPDGVGTLMEKLEALKKQLAAEGLLDRSRKKPIPLLPVVIGIVTSPTSAAIQDMIETIQQRYPSHIRLYPAAVQGEGAWKDLVSGLKRLDKDPDVDVIILGRGGGAFEDLLPFSDERVVRQVAACKTPVVSAVGHETDFPICDLVADERAPTPTGAAQLVVPRRVDIEATLDKQRDLLDMMVDRQMADAEHAWGDLTVQLERIGEQQLRSLEQRIGSLQGELAQQHPAQLLERSWQRSLRLQEKLERALEQGFERRQHRLSSLNTRLLALAPTAPLKRGYALVKDAGGTLLKSTESLRKGDAIQVTLHEGELDATIDSIRTKKR